jgi:serine/threonine-protein kinase
MPDLALEREAIALFERLLDMPDAGRDAWLDANVADHPALLERARAMVNADRSARLRTGAALDQVDEEAAPSRIGAYRIVRRIGRGGMGSVYLGERMTGDFAHQAAIKIIKPGLLSEALVERFQRERQTLASLSHPAIAQLYDGGETDAGSPYIIMEYVDGLPLLGWAEENAPSRAERQRLFREICAAVAFAHRNLVVHRDLTPSNVLVTTDGAVKLIDFGIARPAYDGGPGERGGTSIGSLSLTPGYAAPERMTSREVTTGADIYSLGKLLEKLIAPEPRDRELAAIVARATATDPLDRYPTVDALSDDVAAWQGGLPVAAIAGGRRYRTRKFLGRHRLGVAAGAAVLLLLAGALAVTLIANARAGRALAQSEHRFAETRAIARALLFDAFDEVSRVPGSTRAREYLARTGLTYLEALAGDTNAPVDVRTEAGLGYLRLAQVVGGGQASQLGRYEDGNALLARADQILAGLYAAHPDDAGVRHALAALLIEQAATNLYNNNATGLARQQAQRAQVLLRPEATASLENARLYALALAGEGDSFLWTDAFAEARTRHLAAEAFIQALPAAMRDNPQILAVRSANLRLLGEAWHKLHEDAAAHRVLDQAVSINRALVRGRPDDPALRRKLVVSLRYRAVVLRTDGGQEAARVSIEEARREARTLRDRDPNDIGAAQLYAVVSEVDAQILADLRRFPESYAIGQDVRATHRRLVQLAGNAPGALRSMAQALRTDGGNHYNGGDYAGACAIWRDASAIFADLDRRGALTAGDRSAAAAELRTLIRDGCNPPRRGLRLTI